MKSGAYVCLRKNDIEFCHGFHVFHEVFQNFKPRISRNVLKVKSN